MLNNADRDQVEMVDVRLFAKSLIEKGENKSDDFTVFLQMIPEKLRREMMDGPHYLTVKKQFENDDPDCYNICNVWYHILRSQLKFDRPQILPQKPYPFSFQEIYRSLLADQEKHNQVQRKKIEVKVKE